MGRRTGLLLTILAALGAPGCTVSEGDGGAPVRAPASFASRHFPGVTLDEIETIAGRVFRGHYRVDSEASTPRRLVSRPTEIEGRGEPRSIGDRVGLTPVRQREIAELRVEPQGGGVLVQIQVVNQRLETAERAAFTPGRGDDRPNTTAIDRAGPASVDRREEWRTAGRNRRTEQMILNEIQASMGPTTQPSPDS